MGAKPFGEFSGSKRVSFLAPMQDMTDLPFMRLVCARGSPDFFVSEYIRIHDSYELERGVMDSVLWASERVSVQFIGEDIPCILRALAELNERFPQVGRLDLNLGCPAPKVYRKNVGGGLLREPKKISEIVKAMRAAWSGVFSVKMRTGFADDSNFKTLLSAVMEGEPDFITLHARTVKQLYRGLPNYDRIAEAVEFCGVPIIANGDVSSAAKALKIVSETGCAGVMCGRPAVRNPWIFRQIAEAFAGKKIFEPTLSDVRVYVDELSKMTFVSGERIRNADGAMKKFLNFVGTSIDPDGDFLFKMRRAHGIGEVLGVCDEFMVENANADKLFPVEPYVGLCSRPNHES